MAYVHNEYGLQVDGKPGEVSVPVLLVNSLLQAKKVKINSEIVNI